MFSTQITLDVARNTLVCGDREVRIESRLGAVFLAALWSTSAQQTHLTSDAWQLHLQGQSLATPDRTGMRRLLQHVEQCFDRLGWTGPRPVVLASARGATVGPWRLHGEACRNLVVQRAIVSDSAQRNACLVLLPAGSNDTEAQMAKCLSVSLKLLDCFLISDDLARNGLFTDAATSMAHAFALPDLSPEVQCVVHLRQTKYWGRAGRHADSHTSLAQVARLQAQLLPPMREHVRAAWAVKGWRLRYDDLAQTGQYPEFGTSPAAVASAATVVDAHLMCKALNIQASIWRRHMNAGDLAARQTAFQNSWRDYEAGIYWALICHDDFDVMNLSSNLGYLLHRSGQCGLPDRSVDALHWLMLSQRYIERYEWQDESLWDYVYLAELYLTSTAAREHIHNQRPFVMHDLTPDREDFYLYALKLGERLGEPRQLATMHDLYCQYLDLTRQPKKARAQRQQRDAFMDLHAGLREKLIREANPASSLFAKAPVAKSS